MHLDKVTWQPKIMKLIQEDAEKRESSRRNLEEEDDVKKSEMKHKKTTVVSIPAKEQRSPAQSQRKKLQV